MTTIFYAIIFITSALFFYTISVWCEKYSKRLKLWHVVFFWFGLIADTIGTGQMKSLTNSLNFNLHTILGFIALMVMFLHTIWATMIILKKNESAITQFHRVSVLIWFVWFVAYVSGALIGI